MKRHAKKLVKVPPAAEWDFRPVGDDALPEATLYERFCTIQCTEAHENREHLRGEPANSQDTFQSASK